METKCNTFELGKKLSPKQRKMAELLANPEEIDRSISDMCKQVGVARCTYYRWREDSDFTKYVTALIEVFVEEQLGSVWRAHIKQCKKGNMPAIELYYKMTGKLDAGSKVTLDGSVVFIEGENELK